MCQVHPHSRYFLSDLKSDTVVQLLLSQHCKRQAKIKLIWPIILRFLIIRDSSRYIYCLCQILCCGWVDSGELKIVSTLAMFLNACTTKKKNNVMFQNGLWVTEAGTHRPEPEHLGPENKKEDDHFPLNYSFWIDTRQCQATTNMKQEGERNTCLHKFEAFEGETRQWDLMGKTV